MVIAIPASGGVKRMKLVSAFHGIIRSYFLNDTMK